VYEEADDVDSNKFDIVGIVLIIVVVVVLLLLLLLFVLDEPAAAAVVAAAAIDSDVEPLIKIQPINIYIYTYIYKKIVIKYQYQR